MAAPSVLLEIVRNGNDLTLASPVAPDLLRDLAATARATGAKLTVTTQLAPALITELLPYGKTVAFVDGLINFKKD